MAVVAPESHKAKQKKQKPRRSRRLGFMQLEPRIMYDGAAGHTAAAAFHHHHEADAAQGGPPGGVGAVTPSGGDGHWHPYAAPNNGAATSTTVTAGNDVHGAPALAVGTPNAAYTGTGPAVTLDSGLTVSAPNGSHLTGATVAITSGLQSSDVLSFNNGTDTETFSDGSTITATFNNGVLTLSGKASAIDYQTALQQVQFTSSASNGDPTAGGTDTSRGITWQVNHGGWASAAATSTLAVAEPLPTIYTAVNNPTEIVFIDQQAPDWQLLAGGVSPGIEVVVLNPNTDGVDQIANFLAAHPDPNLTTVDIVAHGSDGMLFLGNAVLDNTTVGQYAAQLAQIGTAVQPGGDLRLYGCDVVADPSGLIFLDQITQGTGLNVAASTGPVGSAAEGGTWTLDASSGPIMASSPFTAATMSQYPDVLNADIFSVISGGSADGIVYGTDNNGNAPGAATSPTDAYSGNSTDNSTLQEGFVGQVQLDTQAGLYFVLLETQGGNGSQIIEGSLSQLLTDTKPTYTQVFSDPNTNNIVNSFQVDVTDNVIFVDDDENGLGAGPPAEHLDVLAFSGANFTGGKTTTSLSLSSSEYLLDMVVDVATKTAYFYEVRSGQVVEGSGGIKFVSKSVFPSATKPVSVPITKHGATQTKNLVEVTTVTQNALWQATWAGSTTAPTGVTLSQLPIAGSGGSNNVPISDGEIVGLALDTANNTLYFDTDVVSGSGNKAGIYSYALTNNSTGTIGTVYTTNSAVDGGLNDLVIDPTTNKYYVDTVNNSVGAIYDGSLSGGNPTLFIDTADSSKGTELDGVPSNGLAFDNGPTLTTSASTVTADQDGSAVTINAPSPGITITDSDISAGGYNANSALASATVSITTNFETGDLLAVPTADLIGTNITQSYNNSTGVLTLSGTDTIADYQRVLGDVTFSTTSGVGNAPRTITFAASDGLLSGSATDMLDVHVLPVVTASGTVTFDGGGSPVRLDSGLTVTDGSSTTLASATVSIGTGFISGDTLSVGTAGGLAVNYDAGDGVLTLTGSASLATYQTALDSITYSVSPTDGDPTGGGSHTTRTIDWVVNDGTLSSTTVTSTLDTVHVAPTVTFGGTATFDGGGSAVVLDAGITVSDVDSGGTLASATVSIGSGYLTGDTLNFTNNSPAIEGDISVSSDAGGQLVLTSIGDTATVAQWQTALESVTYSFSPSNGDPTGGGSDTTRTIDVVVNDGSTSNGTSATATGTVDTVHVAPSVTAGATATFTGGAAATLDGALTVSDVDSGGDLASATVSIGSGFVAGDSLGFTAEAGITASYNSGTGVLTLNGTAALAVYQTELDSITFSTTSTSAVNRTIDWTVSDGSTSHGSSATETSTVEVVAGPQFSGTGTTVSYQDAGAAVPIDSGLGLTDPAGANITSATVSISGGFVSGDLLGIPVADLTGNIFTGTSITENYNSATGVLTLSGSDTAAHYQSVLDAITYGFGGDPTTAGTARTVSYVATDANSVSSPAGVTDTVDLVHTAPTVTAGATATFDGGGSAVTLDGGLTVSDVDSGGNLAGATVSIGSGFLSGDTLNFTNTAAITGSYNAATGVLILTGSDTVADYQAALDSITYSFTPANGDPTGGGAHTSRTIDWTVTDGSTNNGSSMAATSTLDTVHVAPSVTAGATATFTGGGSAVTLDGALTVSDVDSGGNLAGATVSIGSGFLSGDILNFTNQHNITGSYNAATGVLTLTGSDTVADYQAALDSVTFSFSPSFGDPTGGGGDTARTINWTVSDSSSSNGTSNAATSTLDVVHVPPTLTTGGAVTYIQAGTPATLDSTLSLSDPDSNGLLTGATVQISSGFFGGDTLNAITTGLPSITASYNSGTGLLTLSGSDTLADYQAVLRSVTFESSSANPTDNGTDPTRTITWTINDGASTNPTTQTSTVDVHALPTVVAGATVTYEAGSTNPVTLDSGLTVSDDSSSNLTGAKISISGFVSGDELNFANTSKISGSYDPNTGVLTLSGSDTLADYQSALDSISFSTTSPNTGTRTIDWTVSDAASTSAQATSSVTLEAGPQVTAGATATFDGGSTTAVTLDAGLSLADPFSTTLSGATVVINSGFIANGDVLSFNDGSNTETFSDSATISATYSNGALSLTGTASLADYQKALEQVQYSFTPANGDPTGGGGDTTRTISWTVNDGFANSAAATSTLDTVHEAPTVMPSGTTAIYGIGGSAVALDAGLTVSDPDSGGTLVTATVSIGTGYVSGDALNFTSNAATEGNIAVGSNSGGQLVLFSAGATATLAQWDAALESITFSTTTTTAGTRTIDWTVSDISTSNSTSATATSMLDLRVGPQITSLVGQPVNGGTVELKGTANTPGDTIDLYADGNTTTIVGTGTVGSGDTFDITTTADFTDGKHTFTAIETNSSHPTIPASQPFAVEVEALAPTGLAQKGTATNGGTVEITGTGDVSGDTITLYNGNTVIGSGITGANGAFDIVTTASFADGTYANITATDTSADATETSAHSTATTAVVEATAPTGLAQKGISVNGGPIEITGTGDASGDTITLYNGNTVVGSGIAGANGAFDIVTTASFADGTYANITATDTSADATETSTHSSAATAVVTATAPTGLAQKGAATNGGTIEITGTGDASGDTITLYNGNTVVGSGIAGANGAFDIVTTASFADGTYTNITATDTSADATETSARSSAATAVVEATAPTGLAQKGTSVNGGPIEITGIGDASGDTITLYNGNIVVGSGIAGANGAFDIVTMANFADGTYTNITATDTSADATQISAHSSATTAVVEATAPTGLAQKGTSVNGGPIEITGTGDASGDTITLYNGNTVIGSGIAGANGAFDIVTTASFADGSYANITATDTSADTTETSAHSSAATAVVEATAPTGLAQKGTSVNGGTVEITGTGDVSGDTITLYNGNTVIGSGIAGANGAFDIVTTARFADGTYSVTATDTSADGTVTSAKSSALPVEIDPAAPAITALVGQPVNGGTVELQGSGEVGETIELYADGNTSTIVGTGTVGSGGTFDITTTATFADGAHSFTATETDGSNLTSTASSPAFSVNVDPNAPAITALVGQPVNGGTVELKGTGEVGETVTLYADGNTATIVGTGTVGSGGTFDITTTATFADGAHSFTAEQTDAANLTSTASTPAFPVDVDPATPVITALVGHPVNGGTVELQGTGEAGETVDLYADGNTATIVGTGTVGSGGTFDITTMTTFADGLHNFTATETDGSSLTSTASSPAFTVEVNPTAPVITALVGQPVNGGTVELQGTGEIGETVVLYADGNTAFVGIGTVDLSGTFDITTSVGFADGVHNFTATETDGSNLTSAASSPAFAVDIDPNVPVITALVGQPVNGGSVELKGTGEVGDTVDLYADGNTARIVGTGTVGSGGTFDITTTATFADGAHSFTATETDGSSLTSTASSPAFSVDVDPSAPTGLAVFGQPVNGGTVTVTGTGGTVGDTITLYNGSTVIGTGTVVAGDTFSVTTNSTFPDGVYSFAATETDAANLTSAKSSALPVDVDPNAPVITTLVGKPLTNETVELQGTGEVGDTVNLYADGNMMTVVGTGTVGSGGTFDITTTATFGDGVHTFTATETDNASLTSAASSPAFSVDVVHEAPVVTAGATVTFTQNGAAQPLDAALTVSDPDSGGLLTGATVQISSGFLAGDTLSAITTGLPAITTSYNSSTGVLTLSGTDTLADYQAVLRSVSFSSTSVNPSNDGADLTRTVSWSLTDGDKSNGVSAPATSTVDVHAVPTVVAGATVNYQAGPGQSVALDPALGAYDGTSLTGATVTIASGYQSGEVLSANTAGTSITAGYANGVLTLTGKDTPLDYQKVLASVTVSGNAFQSGAATVDWQISDQNLTSQIATSTVNVAAGLAPPPPGGFVQVPIPPNFGHGAFGDFSAMLTNVNGQANAGPSFSAGNAFFLVHTDVNATVADNGSIDFDLPLQQLAAALDGDVVSVTATLADGKPLPAWLQFNSDTGQFAGLVPDDIATGSIGPDGGFDRGAPHGLGSPVSPVITVEIVARDSRGNLAVTEFTIDLSTQTQHNTDKHGWNLLPPGPHRDLALPHAMDRVLWHAAPALDADRVHADRGPDHAPAGRAGFSDQIKAHGWHAAAAQRTALLESLRQGVAGWR